MKNKTKRMAIASLMAITLFMLLGSQAFARTVWVEGRVTRGPWTERHRHIEVDDKKYTLMPDASISLRFEVRPGAYNDRPIAFKAIRVKQKIMARIQGRRIYQLIIFK